MTDTLDVMCTNIEVGFGGLLVQCGGCRSLVMSTMLYTWISICPGTAAIMSVPQPILANGTWKVSRWHCDAHAVYRRGDLFM